MTANFSQEGSWIPLLEYAIKNGVSLSTLRRYIKANKIKYKSESGRYMVWDEDSSEVKNTLSQSSVQMDSVGLGDKRIQLLESALRQAQEENAELKTLVALYEAQIFNGQDASIGQSPLEII
jgi:hypothetical protein